MGQAAREALWSKRDKPKRRKGLAQDGRRGNWAVVRVYEREGRSVVVLSGLSADRAIVEAGRRRDSTTDAQVAMGWNYLPRNMPKKS